MSEQTIKSRQGQRLAAAMATTSLLSLGLLVAPATSALAASRPDLQPTPIRVTQPVKAGQQVYFDSGIANFGDSGTGVFNIKWLVDGQEVGAYGSHDGVPGGSSKLDGNSQFSWTFGDAGSFHTVTFIVDADNHVAERFESNNRISYRVHVR